MTNDRIDEASSNTPADDSSSSPYRRTPATDSFDDSPTADARETAASDDDAPPGAGVGTASAASGKNYGVGPFSLREVVIGGVWFVAFVVSFFSLYPGQFTSVWTGGLWWILTIGAPTVAVFLLALRRLSPEGIRRFGSLGIDQFASVAFSVSLLIWVQFLWQTVALVIERGFWTGTWVLWVEAVLMLAGVVLTVFAPFLPVIGQDFRERPEVPAHRSARPARPVDPRPAAPARPRPTVSDDRSAAPADTAGVRGDAADPFATTTQLPTAGSAERYDDGLGAGVATADPTFEGDTAPSTGRDRDEAFWTPQHTRGTYEPAPGADASDTVPVAPAVSHQAFWALAPVERDVVDETGAPLFRIGPTAWALVIEDRGTVFVVRHEDGRTGFLHDTSAVMRG